MKNIKRILAFLLCLALTVVSFASCNKDDGAEKSDGSDVLMSYEGLTLTEKEYMYILTTIKSNMVLRYQSQLYQVTGMVYDESELLSMPAGDESGKTIAEFINEYALHLSQQLLVIEKMCKDAGIEITNEEDLKNISDYIADVEYNYGGEDRFGIELAKLGFTKEAMARFESMHFLYTLYSDYRYGDNGVAKISPDTVKQYFVDNYVSYDGCRYAFVNDQDNSKYLFDFTDDEIYDYFNKNFVKIRHVLFSKYDSTGKLLSDSLIANKKAEAEKALAEIQAGNKTINDYENSNEDSNHEYVFTKNVMVQEFEKASFEMSIGDVRLVETQYGFHLMKKLDISDADLYGDKASEEKNEEDSDTSSESESSEESATDDEKTEDKAESKTKTAVEKSVIEALSREKILAEAKETLEKLKNGELKEYPALDKEKGYYTLEGPGFADKTSENEAKFAEIINKLEMNVYTECDLGHKIDTYIYRKIPFTADDITQSIYDKIEENLVYEEFDKLINSNFDKINIDKEVLARFDVNKIAVLADEFY